MNTIKTLTVNGKQYALTDDWARERLVQESARVDHLADACPIVCEAHGQVISALDSAEYPIRSLRLYGKTTQRAVPTPVSPVPLEHMGMGGAIGVAVAGTELFSGWQPDVVPAEQLLSLLDTIEPLGRVGSYRSGNVKDPAEIDTASFLGSPDDSYLLILRAAKNKAGMAVNKTTFRLQNLTLTCKQTGTVKTFDFSGMANADGSAADIAVGCCAADGSWVYENSSKTKLKAEPDFVRWKSGSAIEGECFVAFRLNSIPAGGYQVQFGVVGFGAGAAADVYILPGDAPRPIRICIADTPNGLPGIPVSEGGNYTDEHGQQWLCDVLDLTRGVYVQRLQRVVFDKNSTVALDKQAQSPATNVRFNFVDNSVRGIKKQETNKPQAILCNYAPAAKAANNTGVWLNNTNDYFEGRLSVDSSIAGTVEEMKALLAVTPIEFIVPLDKPMEKKLPEAFAGLRSYRPVTFAYNDAGAGMGLAYIADTKTYIDNAIAKAISDG